MRAQGRGGRLKQTGWHDAHRSHFGKRGAAPVELAAWERALLALGLTEAGAEDELGTGSDRARELRAFARRNCLSRFVPEAVLVALGLADEVEKSETLCIVHMRQGEQRRSSRRGVLEMGR